jgi:hypothetical protein
MTATELDGIRAAPIADFLKDRGFRREKNRYACHAHDDKRPSCTIRNNRLRCWVCDRWWSSIDLAMELDGTDFRGAVHTVAKFYGIPLENRAFTPEERRRYAQQRVQIAELSVRLANFHRGLVLAIEEKVEQFGKSDETSHFHRLRFVIRTADPERIAEWWCDLCTKNPAAAKAVEVLGREDRLDVKRITWQIAGIWAAQHTVEGA